MSLHNSNLLCVPYIALDEACRVKKKKPVADVACKRSATANLSIMIDYDTVLSWDKKCLELKCCLFGSRGIPETRKWLSFEHESWPVSAQLSLAQREHDIWTTLKKTRLNISFTSQISISLLHLVLIEVGSHTCLTKKEILKLSQHI